MSASRSLSLRSIVVAATATFALCIGASGASAGYTSITVFGDSLSDGGNDFIYTGGAFPPLPYQQRFTNGPTAVEVMAAHLGLSLTPSLAGGSNYAFGGAETGTGNFLGVSTSVPPVINAIFSGPGTGILSQVQSFVPPVGFGGPQSLVVLWGGPNDLFTALTVGTNPATIIGPAMNNIFTSVATLYGDGARRILMPNMPNIGATPFGLTSVDPAGLTLFSLAFDSALNGIITLLESSLPGLDIIPFDTFAALSVVTANPAAFGLTNVTEPCFTGITLCADPNQYLFWDTVHPTARGHQILGAGFTLAVPEPATIALLGVALLVLVGRTGRERLTGAS